MTDEEIRTRGLAALRRELGRAGLVQFLQQFEAGRGDYTQERGDRLKDISLQSLKERVKSRLRRRRRRAAP